MSDGDVVDFTPDAIRAYLDGCITHSREWRDGSEFGGEDWTMARCYVDAYQSVRTSIFGEILP